MNFHELNMNYFERFWNRFLKNFSRSDSLLFEQTRGSAPTVGANATTPDPPKEGGDHAGCCRKVKILKLPPIRSVGLRQISQILDKNE